MGRALALMSVAAATSATVALSSTAGAASSPGADVCRQAPAPGSYRVQMNSGGLLRRAIVHVPPVAAGRRLPVVLALHGAGQDGAFFEDYSGFSVLADAEGFLAVYPYATVSGLHPFWTINDNRPGAADDVHFISDLLDSVEASQCVDARRIYATGVSNGGGMAARLACQLSGRIAAVAPVAGGYKSQPTCHPVRPVSVLEVHGTSDGAVPYGGTPPGRAGAVMPFLRAWAARDVCRGAPRARRVAPRVLRLDWTRCADGSAVAHLEIFGGGHQLPGALPPDRGQTSTISTVWEVWSFLRAHVLARPYPTPGRSAAARG
jgi:polyhydroxybutyrate depolymerase